MQANNVAAMREACENIAEYAKTAACHTEDAHLLGYLEQIEALAKAALAAPPRNCDMGDAADWEKQFGEECDKGHICSDCPVRHAKTRMAIEFNKGARCEFVWAQMPYEGDATDSRLPS